MTSCSAVPHAVKVRRTVSLKEEEGTQRDESVRRTDGARVSDPT
jgi:hypothetical protein